MNELLPYPFCGGPVDVEKTHIDTLEQTAAERVIARGAAVKPHTFGGIVNQVRDIANQYAGTEQLRERIAYALAPHFERDGGPTPDYTGEGSAWVPPTPVTDAALVEVRSWIHAVGPVGAMVWVDPQEVLKAAGVRVLGEGMVAVDPGLLMLLDKALESCRYAPVHVLRQAIQHALRANQGGAAT